MKNNTKKIDLVKRKTVKKIKGGKSKKVSKSKKGGKSKKVSKVRKVSKSKKVKKQTMNPQPMNPQPMNPQPMNQLPEEQQNVNKVQIEHQGPLLGYIKDAPANMVNAAALGFGANVGVNLGEKAIGAVFGEDE